MTIRQRLFIGNVMMILSPILLIGVTFLGFRSLFTDEQMPGGSSRDRVSVVSVHQSDALFDGIDVAHVASDGQLYRLETGGYVLVIADAYFSDFNPHSTMPFGWVLAFIYLATVVLLANLWLAKYISRKITTPLDALVKGVGEIKNGNLTHRLVYQGGDEFDVIFSDFNDMANELSNMVETRLTDEKNRKELIAGISHDLRTPITAIKMCVDGFKSDTLMTAEKQAKYVDIIGRKSNDLEHIIKQLFLFSKMDMGEFPLNLEVFEIGIEFDKMITDLVSDYGFSGIEVTVINELTDERVLIDKIQFKNVVQNVLSNSLKYAQRADVKVAIACQRLSEDFIEISLQDNGVGVPEEMLGKIFDVFYRGDDSRNGRIKGSGLGLAIASKIIARFGGQIDGKNSLNGGLEVTITLPIKEEST